MKLAIAALYVAWASQYSPGVMRQVVENRQAGRAYVSLPADLPAVDGHIAVADCARLGDIVYLRPAGAESWETHLVVDCAHPMDGTTEWMRDNNIAVEVSYQTAKRWDTVGRGIEVEIGISYPAGLFP